MSEHSLIELLLCNAYPNIQQHGAIMQCQVIVLPTSLVCTCLFSFITLVLWKKWAAIVTNTLKMISYL